MFMAHPALGPLSPKGSKKAREISHRLLLGDHLTHCNLGDLTPKLIVLSVKNNQGSIIDEEPGPGPPRHWQVKRHRTLLRKNLRDHRRHLIYDGLHRLCTGSPEVLKHQGGIVNPSLLGSLLATTFQSSLQLLHIGLQRGKDGLSKRQVRQRRAKRRRIIRSEDLA